MDGLPQSKDCGPIEAERSGIPQVQQALLPQSKACGPIEASPSSGSAPSFVPALPQSTDCGPIEASLHARLRGDRGADFRSRKTAAPLKLIDLGCHERIVGDFRSRKTAAPLKQLAVFLRLAHRGLLPQSKDCGPIEAR